MTESADACHYATHDLRKQTPAILTASRSAKRFLPLELSLVVAVFSLDCGGSRERFGSPDDSAGGSTRNATGAEWSNDEISHGEMLRDGNDEYMTIDTCNLRFLFQGRTKQGSSYNENEYSLGVLTRVQ